MNKLWTVFLALLALAMPSLASSGDVVIYGVTNNGGSPPTYTLRVDDSTGMAVLDHLTGKVSSTASGVWKITTVASATSITVTDNLTEGNGSVSFGPPTTGTGGWGTPTAALNLTLLPFGTPAWDAAFRRNMYLISTASSAGGSHNLLSASHADSTAASAIRGDLIIAQGVSPVWTRKAVGASATFLRSDGTDPAWSSIGTADLPTIPLTGGGTGATSASGARTALSLVPGTDVQVYSSLLAAIAAASATKGHLIVGNGSTWTVLAVGTNGQVLTADSAQSSGLTWSSAGGGGGTHQLLSATHPDTTSATVVRGDLITGQAGPTWARLALGASGRYVRSDGTDTTWATLNMDDAGSGTLPVARGGTGGVSAAAARTALDVQQLDADLTAIAALGQSAGYFLKSVGGVWTSSAPSVSDALFSITDDSDATKVAVFQASGINTGTTRTFTLPNQSGTLAVLSDITATGDFLDTVFRVHDQADATKLLAIETSGITTGTTRTLTAPDASGTIALTADLSGYVPTSRTVSTTSPLAGGGALSSNLTLSLGTVGPTLGGTGLTSFTLGDLLYASATNTLSALAGNTSATKKFLNQTGNGSVSAAPTWAALVSSDIPQLAHSSLSGLTSGDDHTQYALLAGRSGGQTLTGGTGSGDTLTILSTSHGTKGQVDVGSTATALLSVVQTGTRRVDVTTDAVGATTTPHEVMRTTSTTTATAAAGFGATSDTWIENGSGSSVLASSVQHLWTNAGAGTESAKILVRLINGGVVGDALTVGSDGLVTPAGGLTTALNVTTTGSGDLVSGDDLTVADDATITDVLTVNGNTNLGNATADTVTIAGPLSVNSSVGTADYYLASGGAGAVMQWKVLPTSAQDVDDLNSQFAQVTRTTDGTGHTYTIPAGTLAADGDWLEVTGRCESTLNTTGALNVVFGGTTIAMRTNPTNAEYIIFTLRIVRTGAATQKYEIENSYGGTGAASLAVGRGTAAETCSGTIVVKTTLSGSGGQQCNFETFRVVYHKGS